MFSDRSEISNYSLRDSKGKLATHTLASFKFGCSEMMNSANDFEKTIGAQKHEPPASISKFSMVLNKTQEFSRLSH